MFIFTVQSTAEYVSHIVVYLAVFGRKSPEFPGSVLLSASAKREKGSMGERIEGSRKTEMVLTCSTTL